MRIILFFFSYFVLSVTFGQEQVNVLTPVLLEDLSAFNKPADNWKIIGHTTGNFTTNKLTTKKGAGILFNDFKESARYNSDANLFINLEHGDIHLSLDFMIPKGSNSGIYLQGRYEVQLFDSWGITVPRTTDCGSIYERWNDALPEGKKGFEGHPARTNAAFAPGLWQHLEIEFQAPRFNSNGRKVQAAKFIKVMLNGVILHENVVVTGPTRAAAFNDEKSVGPLMIQGDHGPIFFRNIKYALLNSLEARISNLKYEYYEGHFDNFSKVTSEKLIREGTSPLIDSRLADDPNKMCLIFNGQIELPEKDTYQFTIRSHGTVKLEVDGKEIIAPQSIFNDFSASTNLSAGVHTFRLSYLKNFSWASTGLGLFVSKANSRPFSMHVAASLPKTTPVPLVTVKPTSAPELVRSFADFGEKKTTHAISVGDPAGIHYMYDLRQGALLRVWRGEFLNVTDMWHERGESQTASPLGAVVQYPGRCPLAINSDRKTLPDSLDHRKELIYKSMVLDGNGYPVFHYEHNGVQFNDALKPGLAFHGILRLLTLPSVGPPSKESIVIRMAEGKVIEEVGEDLYVVDNLYYIQYKPKAKIKPILIKSETKTDLVLEYDRKMGSTISYNIIW